MLDRKQKQRSTITISAPEFQQAYETKEAIEDKPIQDARVDAVIDFRQQICTGALPWISVTVNHLEVIPNSF